ncbi:MAG: hypothetical protein WCB85_06040 [Candidatus Dormiibacterota bacterium]
MATAECALLIGTKFTSADIPAVILVGALVIAMGLVAVALRWRIRIGSIFSLTPANAVAIIATGSLTSAVGMIAALDPTHQSPGAEAVGGSCGALIGIVALVAGEMVWNGIRSRQARHARPIDRRS